MTTRPSGKYYMEDVHRVGGIPALLKYLLNHTDLIDGSQLTVTGKTLAENLEDVEELSFENQGVIRKLDNPLKQTGHLTILRGNLAPGSAVAKLTGKEGLKFEGIAKCFDRSVQLCTESMLLTIHLAWMGSSLRWKQEKSRMERS